MNRETAHYALEELKKIRDAMAARRLDVSACALRSSSCLNMQDFLTLKKFDLVALQHTLSDLGLSSLSRSHFHLLYTIEQEIAILQRLLGLEVEPDHGTESPTRVFKMMSERSAFLKGCDGDDNAVMITLPSEAATTSFIEDIALSGVNIFRINTAHDTPEAWQAMARKIHAMNATTRRENPIMIYTDLAGPKIRTGNIETVPAVLELRPSLCSSVRLVRASAGTTCIPESESQMHTLAVDDEFFDHLHAGDEIKVVHPEYKNRTMEIKTCDAKACIAVFEKKIFLDLKSQLILADDPTETSTVHHLPHVQQPIRLFTGEMLLLASANETGCLLNDRSGLKAKISCSNNQVFEYVNVGDAVWIDDGKLGLKVERKTPLGLECRVVRAKPKGMLLKPEKGINFPDTKLDIAALTDEDRAKLAHIIGFTDIIGISFVQHASDVEEMKTLLRSFGREDIGIVAKIETKEAIRALPFILMALLSWEKSAVMLARGDLAIEVGFENLARSQEQVLELCEAAHTPVIYATQILEGMMKTALPSRAEVIDASLAQRADCIMLNKGPFAVQTIDVLHKILGSMRPSFFRSLHLLPSVEEWRGFYDTILSQGGKYG